MGLGKIVTKFVRKVKKAVNPKLIKSAEVSTFSDETNMKMDITREVTDDNESEIFGETNRIDQWWSIEEERIMTELRRIGENI
ncbi:hypothetical protein Glove_100g19 [Diversispora epigaea]|uniref:Uncharacterized protein n=1 Tax=Diversispora epigaea TaxID=1348612 RepID=A0A397J6D3_9GLOM|nr:hypothetical protein Glove_100g19 [Diversispora epigaea]